MAVGTTAFPTALDTVVELVELSNNASSTLGAAVLVGATTITIDDPGEFPTTGFATLVDDLTTPTKIEIISWTGKSGSDLTGVLKGRQGSTDQAWSIGDNIEIRPNKGPHEALRGALIAVQTKLGYGASTSTANTVLLGNGTGTSAWGAITNAYVDAAAAIAYSKLNLSGSILNADINASAAIAVSKLAALTASRLPVLDASGFLSASSVTSTEAGYLSGVTSAIQTQLNAKAASGANTDLTSIYLNNTGLKIKDTNASHGLSIVPGSDLAADRVFTLTTGDADRTLTMAGDATISGTNTGDVTLAGTPDYITISGQVITRGAIDLATDITGNLPVTNLNSGTSASASTFWRGDGTWAAPAGSGDVTGPASATDNAVVRFDLTTGKLIQNSVVTIADTTGNMAGVGTLNAHTIPGGTDTFALLAASQTFTNKVLTAPDINGGTADALTSLGIRSTGSGAFDLTFANTENLAAGRTLTLTVNDAARTIDLAGNLTLAAAFITSGANSLTLTTTGATNVTLPTSGTLAIVGGTLAQFAATTSAQLAGVISDETGSGALVFGTAPTFASTITIGTAGGTTGAINLLGTTSGTVTLKVADAAGTYTLTLPTTDGDASQFLQTDGAGVLSWATGGGGLTVGTTAIASGTAGRILYETSGNVLGEIAGSSVDSDGAVQFAASARTSGVARYFRVNTPADTTLTASTESVGIYFGGNGSGSTVTRQWSTGALTTQREYVFVAPTYAFAGASTLTTAATVSITGAPTAGTNATITNPLALQIASGRQENTGMIRILSATNAAPASGAGMELEYRSGDDSSWIASIARPGTAKPINIYAAVVNFDQGPMRAGSAVQYTWNTAGQDTGLARFAAGQVRITNGSTGLGRLIIGSSTDTLTGAFTTLESTATTNAVVNVTRLGVLSTGTAANGFGGRLSFGLESSTTNDQDAGALDWAWTDATHASRTAKLTLSLVGNAAALAAVAEFDMSTTATHTRMLIYDVDNATLERVSVGAADSGGTGFKVLCIPN